MKQITKMFEMVMPKTISHKKKVTFQSESDSDSESESDSKSESDSDSKSESDSESEPVTKVRVTKKSKKHFKKIIEDNENIYENSDSEYF